MENSHRFFQNKDCRYFPCHKVKDSSAFNCLFCYCPLYALGDNCGGNCSYTENGIKDCSNYLIPRSPEDYDYINSKVPVLANWQKRPQVKETSKNRRTLPIRRLFCGLLFSVIFSVHRKAG